METTTEKPTAALTLKDKRTKLGGLIGKIRPTLASLLPAGWNVDRFAKLALVATTQNPDLLHCTPESFLRATVLSAQLGLDPSGVGGEAYFVPFKNRKTGSMEVQFIPGYRGLAKKAKENGNVTQIWAEVVCEKDFFEYSLGADPELVHRPSDDADRGKMIYTYAVARFADGFTQFKVISEAEVMKAKANSQSANSEYSPWVKWFNDMACKTAVKRLCKFLPAGPDANLAIAADDAAEAGESQSGIVGAATIDIPLDAELADPPKQTRTEEIKGAIKQQREPGDEEGDGQ